MPVVSGPPTQRKIVFTPAQYEQVEKMAQIGMKAKQIAVLFGLKPEYFYNLVMEDKKRIVGGKSPPNNLYARIVEGRMKGDTALNQALYNEAMGGNTQALIFLAKTRLKMQEPPAKVELQHSIQFETQIGNDGIIRSGTKPLSLTSDEQDEGDEEWK